ncbi:protein kinase family protein [Streptomyces sp. S3(2020)]|uniref:protein kinase family protein n=1 Tax=Streptomyces sp. S3(2020) TaxID=2732044 RepID=UPI00148808B8|nr:protein kinase family protein [Streptomyces sp. S3(2020)]NNN29068.1 protein kinase family protein [Streptomyces sp. S3(2020)]
MSRTDRRTAHADIAASLSLLSNTGLMELVESGSPLGTGIGGRAALVEVDGRRVFVKRVPLTDLELRPENVRSTENLFQVPPHFHYGIGSPGLGTWRELAVHTMTTDWVLAGHFPGFPLMHHWRVLPDTPRPLPIELADVERAVAYWGGSPAVRERIESLRTASASLALFLEYVPHTLHDWLEARLRTDDADAACVSVERQLRALTGFLGSRGLVHFDAHFQNILTDGHRLHLADYGLSLSTRFRLTPQERAFFGRHRHYDRDYTTRHLVIWLVTALYGHRGQERDDFIRACADGARPGGGIPRAAADIITRYARPTAVMNDFARRLSEESRLTPYPDEELNAAAQAVGTPASR